MKFHLPIIMILATFGACLAQGFNISGTVKSSTGTAISGALVRLGKADISTTSGADGSFKLSATAVKPVFNQTTQSNNWPIKLHDNKLFLSGVEKADVLVKVYDCNGRLLVSTGRTLQSKGHSIDLPYVANGIQIYRVFINSQEFVFTSVARVASHQAGSPATLIAPIRQAAAPAQINDALLISKTGYELFRQPITATTTSNIQATLTALVTGTVSDKEGNSYQTVQFGKQVWTIDNLRSTKYNDGSTISTSSCVFYPGTTDAASKQKWGALYTADVAASTKLAPTGWHVATNADWDTLQSFFISHGYNYDGTTDSNKIAKAMASTADWQTSKEVGAVGNDLTKNNTSGFSGVPGGIHLFDGTSIDRNVIGYWWSSTSKDASYTYYRLLYYTNFDLYKSYRVSTNQCSIRLVKNN